jgi:hypothetical protein
MAQCPICLEHFKEDGAHVPDLPCDCCLIVHLECWAQWSGSCLYCREEVREFPNLVEPQIPYIQQNIPYYHAGDIACIIIICYVIYFYLIINFT